MDDYWFQIEALAPDCLIQSTRMDMLGHCKWGFHRVLFISDIQSWASANSLPIDPSKWNEKQINQFNRRFLNDI